MFAAGKNQAITRLCGLKFRTELSILVRKELRKIYNAGAVFTSLLIEEEDGFTGGRLTKNCATPLEFDLFSHICSYNCITPSGFEQFPIRYFTWHITRQRRQARHKDRRAEIFCNDCELVSLNPEGCDI